MTEPRERDLELLRVHGAGDCHICGKPKASSYPHGRLPAKFVDQNHPEGMWTWL